MGRNRSPGGGRNEDEAQPGVCNRQRKRQQTIDLILNFESHRRVSEAVFRHRLLRMVTPGRQSRENKDSHQNQANDS